MVLSKNALILWANNTDSAYEAAVIVTRLGSDKYEANPKAGLPGDMVLELVAGSVEDAVFGIKNCTSAEVLDQVAQTERRYKSALAMAGNHHLSERAWAIVRANLSASQQHEADKVRFAAVLVDADITEKTATFLADPHTYASEARYHNYAITKATELVALDNGLVDRLLREEATRRGDVLTFSYLNSYYIEGDGNWESLWSHVTMSPETVIGLHDAGDQEVLLRGLLARVARSSVRTSINAALVRLMMRRAPEQDNFYQEQKKRMLFTSEGVDLLVRDPRWIRALLGQHLNDEQFGVLVENATSKNCELLAWMLEGTKNRLESLLNRIDTFATAPEMTTRVCGEMIKCLSGDDRDLIARVMLLGKDDLLLRYISGSLKGRDGKVLLPSEPEILLIAESNTHLVRTRWDLLRKVVQNERFSDEYIRSLVEHLPGMARLVMTEQRSGAMLYEKLLASGVNIEKALSALDKSKTKSLAQVCAGLKR